MIEKLEEKNEKTIFNLLTAGLAFSMLTNTNTINAEVVDKNKSNATIEFSGGGLTLDEVSNINFGETGNVGGLAMIPTRNSITGEVFRLQKNFSVPMTERYMKIFNSKQFVVKVARQLEQLYPEYDVTLAETEENYILRIK